MSNKTLNGNRIADIQKQLKSLDEEEKRLQMIDFQTDFEKARLRKIWEDQRILKRELEILIK